MIATINCELKFAKRELIHISPQVGVVSFKTAGYNEIIILAFCKDGNIFVRLSWYAYSLVLF